MTLGGMGWVLRERQPMDPELDRQYRILETMQLKQHRTGPHPPAAPGVPGR